jgi:conjugative relaxase-like TrwC/TraI family protein
MLRINVHKSAAHVVEYFMGKPGKRETLAPGGNVMATWGGTLIDAVAIDPECVTLEDFKALCSNLDPMTGGERLTRRTKANRRVGYDINFHPAKSVSVLYALTQDARILEAFQRAVDATMQEIEKHAATRVRTFGQDTDRPTGKLLWTKFTHFTSRPVRGIPDPHLHAHCFVFNVTMDPEHNDFKALQLGEIKRRAPYFQAMFHATLAKELEERGFALRRTDKAFELEDVPESVLAKYSSRTREINEAAERLGIKDAKAKSRLAVVTRESKTKELDPETVQTTWQNRLSDDERRAIHAAGRRARPRAAALTEDPVAHAALLRDAMLYARQKCFERESVVDDIRFMAAVTHYGMGRLQRDQIATAIAADTSLIKHVSMGECLITIPEVLSEERGIVEWVKRGQGTAAPLVASPGSFTAKYGVEHNTAIRTILQSTDRVVGLLGKAGTGKTTLMSAAIPAMEAAGHRVIVVAPTAETARGTLRDEGFSHADTLERLLSRDSTREQARGGVWWIDEAGLMSMHDMQRVARLAEALDARVILAGDPGQHRAVRRGDAFRILIEHAGLQLATLKTIRRQQGEYREAVEHVAEYRLQDAFEKLDDMGAFVEVASDVRHETLAREYLQAIAEGKTALVVSPTHAEGRAVTALIRSGLRECGVLGVTRHMPGLQKMDIQDADIPLPRIYRQGWVIELRRNAAGYRKGTRLQVTSADRNGVNARDPSGAEVAFDVQQWAGRFHVYEPVAIPLAIGERIRITETGKSLEGVEVRNGSLHTIEGFTAQGDIKLRADASDQSPIILSQHFAHLAHGYCTTSYAAQSKTVEHVFVAESSMSFNAASREQFYVSISRGRAAVRIFTDCVESLFEAVRVSSQRRAALDLAWDMPPERAMELLSKPEQSHAPGMLAESSPVRTRDYLGGLTGMPTAAERKRMMEMELD